MWPGEASGGGRLGEDTSDTMAGRVWAPVPSLPEAMPRPVVTNQPGESPAQEGRSHGRPGRPCDPREALATAASALGAQLPPYLDSFSSSILCRTTPFSSWLLRGQAPSHFRKKERLAN